MKRSPTLLLVAVLSAAVLPASGQIIGSRERGDAVYHNLTGLYSLAGYDHAGIYYGYFGGDPADLDNHRVIEVGGLYDVVRENSYDEFVNGEGRYYYGSHTNPGVTASDRAAIIATAEDFRDNSNLTYTIWGQIDWNGLDWDGTIADLDNIRCDGLVECCYEMNGVNVWGREGSHFSIIDYPEEHNNMPDFVDADPSDGMTEDPRWEPSPKAQRGGLGSQYTQFGISIAYHPVVRPELSGDEGYEGWYRSDVEVALFAEDISGIHQENGRDCIQYGPAASGPWAVYTESFNVTDTARIYARSLDRAGNIPASGSEAVYVKIDRDSPPETLPAPLFDPSCRSMPTITGYTVSDSGPSGIHHYEYRVDGDETIRTTTAASFQTIPLGEGVHTVYVRAVDRAGNEGPWGSCSVEVDFEALPCPTPLPGTPENDPGTIYNVQILGGTSFPASGSWTSGCVEGNYLYLAAGGLFIFDIGDPASPRLVGSYPGGWDGEYGVVVRNWKAYTIGYQGLKVFDVSNPAQPVLIGSTTEGGGSFSGYPYAKKMYISGDYVYAFASFWDISDPTDPAYVWNLRGAPAYVSGGYQWWFYNTMLGIGEPLKAPPPADIDVVRVQPYPIRVEDASYAYDMHVQTPYVYLVDNRFGLTIYDLNYNILGKYLQFNPWGSPTYWNRHLAVAGNRAYIGSAGDIPGCEEEITFLQIVDVADPSATWLAGQVGIPGITSGLGTLQDLCVKDGCVYMIFNGRVLAFREGAEGSPGSGFDFPIGDRGGNPVENVVRDTKYFTRFLPGDYSYNGESYQGFGIFPDGDFLDPGYSGTIEHPGEDWNGSGGGATDGGQPVRAIGAGLVRVSADFGGPWGKVILVEHEAPSGSSFRVTDREGETGETAAKVWSLYAHLDNRKVSAGDPVSGGQILGGIGNADGYYGSGYHLHFEVRYDTWVAKAMEEWTGSDWNSWAASWGGLVGNAATVEQYWCDPTNFILANRSVSGGGILGEGPAPQRFSAVMEPGYYSSKMTLRLLDPVGVAGFRAYMSDETQPDPSDPANFPSSWELMGTAPANGAVLRGDYAFAAGTRYYFTVTVYDELYQMSEPYFPTGQYVPTSEWDSDSDGLPDSWEMLYWGHLDQGADDDPDEDELSNLEELAAGSDPTKADTDGDGHADGEEVAGGFDPTNPASHPFPGDTVYVDAANAAGSGDGTAEDPFLTISAAIAAAGDNYTIEVAAGVYPENITLKVGMFISGAGPAITRIEGVEEDDTWTTVQMASGSTISGFAIFAFDDFNGIDISDPDDPWNNSVSGVTVQNNVIVGGCGIWAWKLSASAVVNNTILAYWAGIYLTESEGVVVKNNVILTADQESGEGIVLDSVAEIGGIAISYNDVVAPLPYSNSATGEAFVPVPGTGEINSDPILLPDSGFRLDSTSPAIDAGDPADDWSREPDYPAGAINMGAYGGTTEAEEPAAGNQSPVAEIADPGTARSNTVTLDGSGSDDPDGSIIRYDWYLNGEYLGSEATRAMTAPPVAVRAGNGTVEVSLVVFDNYYVSDSASRWITFADHDRDGIADDDDPDDDNDGMPDEWEIAYGLDPLTADCWADPDQDGLSNCQEYQAGSDPLSGPATPTPQPTAPLLPTPGLSVTPTPLVPPTPGSSATPIPSVPPTPSPAPSPIHLVVDWDDYSGDGQSDIAIYHPVSGAWDVLGVTSGLIWGGGAEAIPVPGDYDGDGKADIGYFDRRNGEWNILQITGEVITTGVKWGACGDLPVPGDYSGDGTCDFAVWRPSDGRWRIRDITNIWFGEAPGIYPVPGDYNGDGTTDIAMLYPTTGIWYVREQRNRTWWSPAADDGIARPMDYDGDGTTDLAFYRPSTGWWYIRHLEGPVGYAKHWGIPSAGDLPVVGDFDGDGAADLTAYRPEKGRWWILYSSQPYFYVDFSVQTTDWLVTGATAY